jgi:hypothetical protein
MSRIYTVPYAGTLTNAGGNADLFELLPGDDKPIRLRGLVLGQTSEVADAAEESVNLNIVRLGATVTGGNGTSVTPVPLDPTDTAAGFTAEANGATVATTDGTTTIVEEFAWNLRLSPLERWWPDPEFAPMCRQGSGLFLRCATTVADDVSIAITAYVEEL